MGPVTGIGILFAALGVVVLILDLAMDKDWDVETGGFSAPAWLFLLILGIGLVAVDILVISPIADIFT